MGLQENDTHGLGMPAKEKGPEGPFPIHMSD